MIHNILQTWYCFPPWQYPSKSLNIPQYPHLDNVPHHIEPLPEVAHCLLIHRGSHCVSHVVLKQIWSNVQMCSTLIYLGGVLHSEGKVQTRKKPHNVSQLEKKETRVLLWKNTLLKLPLCSESLLEFCFKGKMLKSREMRRSAQVWGCLLDSVWEDSHCASEERS